MTAAPDTCWVFHGPGGLVAYHRAEMAAALRTALGDEAAAALDVPPPGCDVEADLARWWAGESGLEVVGPEVSGIRLAPWASRVGELGHLARTCPDLALRIAEAETSGPAREGVTTREMLARPTRDPRDSADRWVPSHPDCPVTCRTARRGCLCWRSFAARK